MSSFIDNEFDGFRFNKFDVMPQSISADWRLSPQTKWILVYLLNRKNWQLRVSHFVGMHKDSDCPVSERSVYRSLKTLIECGYMVRSRIKEGNRFAGIKYTLLNPDAVVVPAKESELCDFEHVQFEDVQREHVHREDVQNRQILHNTDSLHNTEILQNTDKTEGRAVDFPAKAEKTNTFEIPPWVPAEAWNGFVEMRKATKKPLTPRAVELAIQKLDKLRQDGNDPAAVLDQSTMSNYQGLFPLKDQPKVRPRTFAPEQPHPDNERYRNV